MIETQETGSDLVHDLIEEGRIQCWPIVEPRLARQLILATSKLPCWRRVDASGG